MTDGLSRRDLVMLAGAGLAVSSCDRGGGANSSDSGDNNIAESNGIESVYFAPCDDHGLPANTRPGGVFALDFRAPYVCVIHINFSKPWKIWINYASFPMEGKFGDDDRLEKVKKVLTERFDTLSPNPPSRFSMLTQNPPYRGIDYQDFAHFGFKSQHELFFFFESTDIELDADLLAVFTRRSTVAPSRTNDPNHSFIHARPVLQQEMGPALFARGRMFRMRNYVQFKGGGAILAHQEQKYSMNIHFKIRAETNAWVPMVIDPETGNGTGHEP